ncbi:MAG: hypothetical protein ACOZE5_02410 [Verrucomicrobiota bacterium]
MSNICNAPARSLRGLLAAVLLAMMFVATGRLTAGRNDAVTISATSAPGYVRPLDAEGRPRPESYVFTEGAYFGGTTVDGSLDRMTFDSLTRVLAVNLAAQEYYPTKELASANLLIRVFWGATEVFNDPQKTFAVDALNSALSSYGSTYAANETADPGDINVAMEQIGAGQENAGVAARRNAALLGYRRTLDRLSRKAMPSPEEVALRTELSEERYFVVLMAYDYQFMRREKKPKLLWVTRLSMRGPGNNFTEALPALALAGAEAYGRSLDRLHRVRVNDRKVEVIMGDLKILGVEETPRETKTEK